MTQRGLIKGSGSIHVLLATASVDALSLSKVYVAPEGSSGDSATVSSTAPHQEVVRSGSVGHDKYCSERHVHPHAYGGAQWLAGGGQQQGGTCMERAWKMQSLGVGC